MNIARIAQALIARLIFWGKRRCNVCGHRVGRFLPYRGGWKASPSLMRALNVIGSDLENHECPWCGAHDRERHLLMYMHAGGLVDALPGMAILHFAPERRLAKLIKAKGPERYIKCDLYPNAPDMERIDMLAIPYPDESFDLVIANHVLEHVADDIKALREIRRILKVGGLAILQTPFSPKLHHTWMDAGIDNDLSRRHAYGQEDHIRLFGKDIFARFSSTGLVSHMHQHDDLLSGINPKDYGVNAAEPFFLFGRQED